MCPPATHQLSSAISTNSRSRIFFTILDGRVAVWLYGPGADRDGDVALGPSTGGMDLGTDVAAAASNSRPLVVAGPGVKV